MTTLIYPATAYSQVHSLDAATKSRNFGIRVFLAGMAFLLFSAWVFVNWDIARHSSIQRNKKSSVPYTVNTQRFKITITLPQLRIALIISLLTQIMEKNKI